MRHEIRIALGTALTTVVVLILARCGRKSAAPLPPPCSGPRAPRLKATSRANPPRPFPRRARVAAPQAPGCLGSAEEHQKRWGRSRIHGGPASRVLGGIPPHGDPSAVCMRRRNRIDQQAFRPFAFATHFASERSRFGSLDARAPTHPGHGSGRRRGVPFETRRHVHRRSSVWCWVGSPSSVRPASWHRGCIRPGQHAALARSVVSPAALAT